MPLLVYKMNEQKYRMALRESFAFANEMAEETLAALIAQPILDNLDGCNLPFVLFEFCDTP